MEGGPVWRRANSHRALGTWAPLEGQESHTGEEGRPAPLRTEVSFKEPFLSGKTHCFFRQESAKESESRQQRRRKWRSVRGRCLEEGGKIDKAGSREGSERRGGVR